MRDPILTDPSAPSPESRLVGRSDAIAQILRALDDRSNRLISLVGPGGVGKTSLARAVAAEVEGNTESRVPLVELVAITDPALMLPAIASAVTGDAPQQLPALEAIAAAIGDRVTTLILDNLEQLPGAAEVVDQLLSALPAVQILVTSRVRLNLRTELVIEIQPLATPASDAPETDPAALRRYAAIELFEARVQEVRPEFQVTSVNSRDVVAIVRQLEGLPLAIELVASRARNYSMVDLRPRLNELLPLPQPGVLRLPDRQRTVLASIAWSVDLLPVSARDALYRLSVFPARFDLAAARAVADAGIGEIDTLIEHHLLRLAERDGARNRFDMPESVREFARARFRMEGNEEELCDRHAAWRHALTDGIEREYFGPNWQAALKRHLETLDDFHQAIGWSIERGNAAQAIGLFIDLNPHWTSLPWETAELWWHRIEPLFDRPDLDPALVARAFIEAGRVAYGSGKLRESDRYFILATDAARRSCNKSVLALAIRGHGSTLRGLTETDRAAALLEELRALSARVTEVFAKYAAFLELGAQALMIQGDYDTAWSDFQQALAITRQARATTQEGNALHFLGYVAAMRGDFDFARDAFQRSVRLQAEGPETQRLSSLHGLGRTELLAGRYGDAYTALRESLAGRQRRGETLQVRFILTDLALLARATGRPRLAAEWFGAANLDQLLLTRRRFFADRWIEAVGQTRAELGDAAFERELDRGRLMGLDEAVAAAIALAAPRESGIKPEQTAATELSPRELEVLRLLVNGASDRQIGEALFISPLTATQHVKNILRKLKVGTRTAAAMLAVRRGIIRTE